MARVRDVLEQPQLQLRLLAGEKGLDRELEWAHTCDLPDPWNWVGERQALLTNGSAMPADPENQVGWAERLDRAGVAAVGIGVEMSAPDFSPEFIARCDGLGLPCFLIPYPLSFSAVAQAVAASASLAEAKRLRIIGRLYDLTTRDLSASDGAQGVIDAVEELVGHDIAIIDAICAHSWVDGAPAPAWLPTDTAVSRAGMAQVPRIHEIDSGENVHVVPLAALPGALAWFRPRPGNGANQHLLLHAAALLGAALARRALDELQENRRKVEYLDRILLEQDRFGVSSGTWMHLLGFEGTARGISLVDGTQDDRESTVRRLQRHGVRLTWTLQQDRHLLVAQHPRLVELVGHALEGDVHAGIGSEWEIGAVHQSLRESIWSRLTVPAETKVAEFSPAGSWMGFHDPGEAEHFVQGVLGGLLDPSPMRVELLLTLRTYLRLDRSLKRTAEQLTVHRQTVVQRLHKVEDLLGMRLGSTDAIARIWVALELHESLL